MQKEPSFTLRLSELDKVLMRSNPFFRIIPLRIVMEFRSMSPEQLRDLREYADADDGRIERWILVPSAMPLSVLGYTIDRAFGLIPSPQSSSFLLPDIAVLDVRQAENNSQVLKPLVNAAEVVSFRELIPRMEDIFIKLVTNNNQ